MPGNWQPIKPQGRTIHTFKQGSPIPQDKHQEVGEVLDKLLQERQELTPYALLDEARGEESTLHSYFDWDDEEAAEKWRVQTARQIINHWEIKVVNISTEEESSIRGAVSVKVSKPEKDNGSEPEVKRVYVRTVDAFKEQDLREQVIDNARRELTQWRERYKMYQEFDPVFVAIDKVIE